MPPVLAIPPPIFRGRTASRRRPSAPTDTRVPAIALVVVGQQTYYYSADASSGRQVDRRHPRYTTSPMVDRVGVNVKSARRTPPAHVIGQVRTYGIEEFGVVLERIQHVRDPARGRIVARDLVFDVEIG